MVCQVAKVNKILASIAGFCDAGNNVLFKIDGGEIIHLATGKITSFKIIGNIYVMDAYLPNPDFEHDEKEDEAIDSVTKPVFRRLGDR